jgi:beta-mannosidase
MLERQAVGGWRVAHVGGPRPGAPIDLPATVPGVVHLDLQSAGLIADPYLDANEALQHWVGESDWEYRTVITLDRSGGERFDLVFDGLDTVATVSLDGEVVLRAENMHRRYRVDVTSWADGAPHDLVVRFEAPTTWAARRAAELGDLPNPYDQPYNVIRKMAANFGWDWGPRLTTSGIWKPVWVERWSGARLAAVRPNIDVADNGTGVVDLVVELERADRVVAAPIEVVAEVGGAAAAVAMPSGATVARLRIEVLDVERWWPRGRGAQALYPLVVELRDSDTVLDRIEQRVGFRTIEVDTTADADGSRWAIVINGERVWVRGVNWIPDDCFPSRVDRTRYAARLGQAVDANANLVRVWGGGIYETDDFYELCDDLGLLVWQDFLFACAAYPEVELWHEVDAEARDAVDRLMHHPSLALWNGNNENHWGWWDWGWQERLGGRPWGLGFYEDLLPRLVAELDPNRPYLRSSPSSGDDLARHPNDQAHGPIHIWDVWNQVDYTEYRRYQPRFVSEFGFQAPPTLTTLERAVTARALRVDHPDLLHHQKADDGHAKLRRALDHHFGPTSDLERWHFLTQLNQARAIEVGVGHLRRLHQRCSGAVWWQLNDCWPVVSWSIVDGDGRKKLSWYALRRAFDDHLLVVEPDGDQLVVAAVNDSRRTWSGSLAVERVSVRGEALAVEERDLVVPPDDVLEVVLPSSVGRPVDGARELLRVRLGDRSAWWTWAPDRELDLPDIDDIWFNANPTDDGIAISIVAPMLLRDLCVLADRLSPDAETDSQLVSLLPGESHTFSVTGATVDDVHQRMGRSFRAVNLRR